TRRHLLHEHASRYRPSLYRRPAPNKLCAPTSSSPEPYSARTGQWTCTPFIPLAKARKAWLWNYESWNPMLPRSSERDGTLSNEESTMTDPGVTRNPREAERLFPKHVAFVGCGSGGSAVALMAARAGIGKFTLVDPDLLALENVGRHMLSRGDVGKPKVEGIKAKIRELNPLAEVDAIPGKFEDFGEVPDLIIAGTDSFSCEAAVNSYSLRNGTPAVYSSS